MSRARLTVAVAAAALLAGCGSEGRPVRVVVPPGATLATVTDTLLVRGLVGFPFFFEGYARARGAHRNLKAGQYELDSSWGWERILRTLTQGRVATVALTVPEGLRLTQIAPLIAEVTGDEPERVAEAFARIDAPAPFGLPGPGLEGYLFPDTYRFAQGVPLLDVIETMTARYRKVWTPERRARLDTLGMSEREVVTLASIIQAEAQREDEMPRISSVYHNRLRRGMRLEADPTVLYALGGWRERLLYAAMDSVADHPYNTYRQRGLPPGPIGAPGERALDAALQPAEEPYIFFVAFPDGSHVFTRTLAEHNRARAEAARARSANAASQN